MNSSITIEIVEYCEDYQSSKVRYKTIKGQQVFQKGQVKKKNTEELNRKKKTAIKPVIVQICLHQSYSLQFKKNKIINKDY